ncbi:hypothetical protein GCM10007424_10640 [Flavobacterium suaedae]|uniref:SGNH hydrolase-type esterase domain-containing protein n=1 Tax=Flavobacterium suaedae TaxID=1767027 RepID=A0ABQ1JR78_9FLAO|nr:GDSL-type esterase/lipase family protein [Flavobacterium suaedae]GGB72568.1 hypothetical protein GCM10007424_10640 [Flavobacterium suaedae]
MKPDKPYFFQSFAIVVLSIVAFFIFKQFLPRKIFSEQDIPAENVLIDSMVIKAIQEIDTTAIVEKDTVPPKKKIKFKKKKGIKYPTETFDGYKGHQHLIAFYEKLLALEEKNKGSVRIAYFGDSMTDGDLIVQDFRSNFQERFGGTGVGFVNITSESANARITVKHTFSRNWDAQSYINTQKPTSPFGVNGHVFFTKHDTVKPIWVNYKAGYQAGLNWLQKPTLFYGKSNNKEAEIEVFTKNDTIIKKLTPEKVLNTLTLSQESLKEFKAQFIAADSIPFYGFNFDDGKGVHVDNFSSRGNSGLPISIFNTRLMRAFDEKLGYDLIVLHYGTNVLNYGSYNYGWYTKRMGRVVQHIRECFPNADILIISTADKSSKYDMEMKTDSAVVPLTLAQKRYAVEQEAAFVNLYLLMGGENSMVEWVEQEKPLANKDYTHFNYRGAKKVAGLVYQQLMDGYEEFKKMKKESEKGTKPKGLTKASSVKKTDSLKPADSLSHKKDTIINGY